MTPWKRSVRLNLKRGRKNTSKLICGVTLEQPSSEELTKVVLNYHRLHPSYLVKLVNDALEALRKIKLETRTKEYLKADMWCHFGTAIIRGPDEGSIELPSITPTFKNAIAISNTKPADQTCLT